jgi:ABC-2 type transport system ATP-binding protein
LNPIEISDVKKTYGPLHAVDGVSFSVRQGEVFSLLGPNGAGKTTTIEIMEGLRNRDGGQVKILGLDPWANGGVLHRKVGVVPQNFTFFEKATPREALKYYGKIFGLKIDPDEILKEVLLEDSSNNMFENLSGGQKQKLGFALSLVNSPELLFLDEPSTGLDPNARRAVWDVVKTLKENGKTILLTTHYLEEAEHLADRVAIMNHGRVIATGTSDEIISSYGSGERLEIRGGQELNDYLRVNTKFEVDFSQTNHLISIAIPHKHDAFDALNVIEKSGLEWMDLRTKNDNLEDVFVKLVGGVLDHRGEIKPGTPGNGIGHMGSN